jgi:hypothetical protein
VSDDGCGCIVALAVVGVVGYGAWAYLQPHPPDTSMVDARSTAPQVRPIEEAPSAGPSATAAVPTSPPREACAVISRTPVSSSMIRSIGYCGAQRRSRSSSLGERSTDTGACLRERTMLSWPHRQKGNSLTLQSPIGRTGILASGSVAFRAQLKHRLVELGRTDDL